MEVFLYYIVYINQRLEIDFPMKYTKLDSPLPLHSSFIPIHIRLDTLGIAQHELRENQDVQGTI